MFPNFIWIVLQPAIVMDNLFKFQLMKSQDFGIFCWEDLKKNKVQKEWNNAHDDQIQKVPVPLPFPMLPEHGRSCAYHKFTMCIADVNYTNQRAKISIFSHHFYLYWTRSPRFWNRLVIIGTSLPLQRFKLLLNY